MNEKKNIVILGGGFAGLYTYLNLRKFLKQQREVGKITIISNKNYFLFTPLLHEVATGSVNQSNIIQPLLQITNCKSERFLNTEVLSVDTEKQTVQTSFGDVSFDYLVLALGSKTRKMNFLESQVFTLKTLEDAKRIKNQVIENFEKANEEKDLNIRKALLSFVIIGGGPTGVEITAELLEFTTKTLTKAFPNILEKEIKIYLVHSKTELLQNFEKSLRQKTLELFAKKQNLEILLNEKVVSIETGSVRLSSGKKLSTQMPILVAGVEEVRLPIFPLVTSQSESLVVDEYLRLVNHKNIFVLGDMANIFYQGKLVPKTAQAAVEQGKTVAENLKNLLQGKPLVKYVYSEKGQLVSLGRFTAVAQIYKFNFFGLFAWWMWRTVYASKIIGFANRLRVVMDWTIDIFYSRDISKL